MRRVPSFIVTACIGLAAAASMIGLTWGAVVATEHLGDRQKNRGERALVLDTRTEVPEVPEAPREGTNILTTIMVLCATMIVVTLFVSWNASLYPAPTAPAGPITDNDLLPLLISGVVGLL